MELTPPKLCPLSLFTTLLLQQEGQKNYHLCSFSSLLPGKIKVSARRGLVVGSEDISSFMLGFCLTLAPQYLAQGRDDSSLPRKGLFIHL